MIHTRFSLKCGEACGSFCFSSPSVPIKAVFLQQILSWWRQPLRALEVKSHRTCVADGLCKSYVQREIAEKKETNKHKNGSPSPARSSFFFFFYPTQFKTYHFQMFKLFLKNVVKPAWDKGKHKIFFFCGEFLQPSSKAIEKKKCWKLLDLKALTSSPSSMETSFAPAFPYKGWDSTESRHQRTAPNGYKSSFPPLDYMFQKDKAWSVFLEGKKASFVMQMKADREVSGINGV